MKRGNLYQFGPFSLDAGERVLLREGRLVPLAPKALSTLVVLLQNMGHVVEKDALMAAVWPDEDVEEGNLAQHIFMVRKALGETNGSPEYIETVPRRGYRFVAPMMEHDHVRHDNEAINSLAILPFSNASNDPNMEYLSDGITESVINILSQLPQLKVMASSTVFRYKGIEIDPQEVGRSLGVRAVMVGRVQQLGQHVVIGAELINVWDGSRIWGNEYHSKSSDIFSVQEELAWDISESLRLRLSGAQKERLAKRFTENPEAYEFYLRGRYSWSKLTNEELKKGVEYFRQAIAKDPNYSLAHAGLADCLCVLGLFGSERPRLVMPQAKTEAMRAIQLDQTLGDAYASLAQVKFYYDWDWTGAEKNYQQALRLSPTSSTAHDWHGAYLAAMGLMDEALTELKRARDLDQLSQVINTDLGLGYYWARRYDLAIEQLKWAIELEPGFFRSHLHLGMAYQCKLMYREAIAELEEARSINENPWTLAGLGHAYASVGRAREADQLMKILLEYSRIRYVSAVTVATIHVGFEDRADQTLEWLEKAYEERAGLLVWLKVNPKFDTIRSDARFVELLQRIGFGETPAEKNYAPTAVDNGGVEFAAAINGRRLSGQNNRRSTDGVNAQEISQTSQSASLNDKPKRLLAKDYTEDSAAYQAYLKGRYCWSKHTREGLKQAIDYFRQAITLGPNYALAYAGIVDCYLRLATSYLPPAEDLPKTESLKSAVEIDEASPVVQASIKIRCEWDKSIADREHQHFIKLKYDDLAVHQWHAAYLFARSLYQKSLMNAELALDSITNEAQSLVFDVRLSNQPEYSSLTLAEEVQVFCAIGRAQIDAGNYDAACAVLERWWTMGEWPKLERLSPYSSADLLFTTGVLAGGVASTSQVPKGWKHAEALLSGAIGLFEQLGLKTLSAQGRSELGNCYYREGMFDLARNTMIAALEVLSESDRELRSLSLVRLASFERHAGRLRNAFAIFKEVAEIGELSPWAAGRYHCELGANLSESLNEQGLDHFEQAVHLFKAIGHHRYTASAENNYGYLFLKLGRIDEAEIHLKRARRLFETLADKVRRAQVDETLAQLYLAAERFEIAEQAIFRSVDTLETGGEDALLTESLTVQGRILARVGRYREAKRVLERAYLVAERCGDRNGAAGAILTEVEEMCDQLENEERLELGDRLDQLLADSQQASTLDRLRKCHELMAEAYRVSSHNLAPIRKVHQTQDS